jgi:hypothetical protein
MTDPYRPVPPPRAGPVKCSDCAFGLETPPLDCLVVPDGVRLRSLRVVKRRWKADSPEGCKDFVLLSDLKKVAAFARERGNVGAVAEIEDLMMRREAR